MPTRKVTPSCAPNQAQPTSDTPHDAPPGLALGTAIECDVSDSHALLCGAARAAEAGDEQ